MERMTERNKLGDATFRGGPNVWPDDVANRLVEIEDILGHTYDLARLKELVEADREGMVPKYKIGDIVHDIFDLAWEVVSVECHTTEPGKHEWLYRLGHNGTPDYSAMYENEILANEAAEKALEGRNG